MFIFFPQDSEEHKKLQFLLYSLNKVQKVSRYKKVQSKNSKLQKMTFDMSSLNQTHCDHQDKNFNIN